MVMQRWSRISGKREDEMKNRMDAPVRQKLFRLDLSKRFQ